MKTTISVSLQPNEGGPWTHLYITVDYLVPLCGEVPRVIAGGISWQVQRLSFEPATGTLFAELVPMICPTGQCDEYAQALRAEGWK